MACGSKHAKVLVNDAAKRDLGTKCTAAVLHALLSAHASAEPISDRERDLLNLIEDIVAIPGIAWRNPAMPTAKIAGLIAELLRASPSRAHIVQALRLADTVLSANSGSMALLIRSGVVTAIANLRAKMPGSETIPRGTLAPSVSNTTDVSL